MLYILILCHYFDETSLTLTQRVCLLISESVKFFSQQMNCRKKQNWSSQSVVRSTCFLWWKFSQRTNWLTTNLPRFAAAYHTVHTTHHSVWVIEPSRWLLLERGMLFVICSFCAIAAAVPPRPQDGTVSVIVLFTIVSSCVIIILDQGVIILC